MCLRRFKKLLSLCLWHKDWNLCCRLERACAWGIIRLLFFTWIRPTERRSTPVAHFIRRGKSYFAPHVAFSSSFFWTSGFCKVYVLEFSLCRSIVRNRFSCSKSHTHCTIKSTDILKLLLHPKKVDSPTLKKKRDGKKIGIALFSAHVLWIFSFFFFLNWLLLFAFFALFSVGSLDVAMTRCRISTLKKKDGGWERQILFYSNFRSVCMARKNRIAQTDSTIIIWKQEREGKKSYKREDKQERGAWSFLGSLSVAPSVSSKLLSFPALIRYIPCRRISAT